MDTKNNTKKRKKILWLSIFLIIAVVIVSFVIHLRINGALLSNDAQDVINKYKETLIESVQIPGIIESDTVSEQSKEDAKKILELQNTIKDLQKKISASNTTDYGQVIKFVVTGSLLSNKLQTNGYFSKELESILKTPLKPVLKAKIDKISPYAEIGIKTQQDLIKDYQKVYQQTYSSYLKEDPSFVAKVKSYFLYLVFVKKTQNELLADDTKIVNKLANIETYLRRNELKKAYSEFATINIVPSSYAQNWIANLQERIEANDVISEINTELNNYINLGSK